MKLYGQLFRLIKKKDLNILQKIYRKINPTKLIGIGIDVDGFRYEFECRCNTLYCTGKQLVFLTIPEGVTHVYCFHNQLTSLNLPEGVESVSCCENQITYLDIPDSLRNIHADKEVAGLDTHSGVINTFLY